MRFAPVAATSSREDFHLQLTPVLGAQKKGRLDRAIETAPRVCTAKKTAQAKAGIAPRSYQVGCAPGTTGCSASMIRPLMA